MTVLGRWRHYGGGCIGEVAVLGGTNVSVAVCLQELVGNNPYDQNWRSIVISVLVIVAVCGLIALSIILVMPRKTSSCDASNCHMFNQCFEAVGDVCVLLR